MALFIHHNLASHKAHRTVSGTNRGLLGSFEKVSSGLRINKAADDAAGLGVAENLNVHFRSTKVAMRNTNDGIGIVQTAEGATEEVANVIKRMRELAVQSSSEALDATERVYLDDEFLELSREVNRIADTTEWNGVALTNGSSVELNIQVGVNNTGNDRIAIELGDLNNSELGISDGGPSPTGLSSVASARVAIRRFDRALDTVNGYRSVYGATQNRLVSAVSNLEIYNENLASAEAQIRDVDFASETAVLARHQIIQQAGLSVLSQANSNAEGLLSLL